MNWIHTTTGMGCCFFGCGVQEEVSSFPSTNYTSAFSIGCCIKSYFFCPYFPVLTQEPCHPSTQDGCAMSRGRDICFMGCCFPSNRMGHTEEKISLCVVEGCTYVCHVGLITCCPLPTQSPPVTREVGIDSIVTHPITNPPMPIPPTDSNSGNTLFFDAQNLNDQSASNTIPDTVHSTNTPIETAEK